MLLSPVDRGADGSVERFARSEAIVVLIASRLASGTAAKH
jgi:hypothetical protein